LEQPVALEEFNTGHPRSHSRLGRPSKDPVSERVAVHRSAGPLPEWAWARIGAPHTMSAMRRISLRLRIAALMLVPCACHAAPDHGGLASQADDALRLPRIRIVVEVDVLGTSSPSVRAEITAYPTHRLP
jgi:hypothetical protein